MCQAVTKERNSREGKAKTWKAFGIRSNGGLHEPTCEMPPSLESKGNKTFTVSSTCLDASIDGDDLVDHGSSDGMDPSTGHFDAYNQ